MSRSTSPSKSNTYSHILYLSEPERANYIAGRMSPALSSRSSVGSSISIASGPSHVSSAATPATSVSRKDSYSPKWVDEHYPLITSTDVSSIPESVPRTHTSFFIAREMAQIHNTLIRAINASYNFSTMIKPSTQEAEDFLLFNQQIFKTIDHHHHTEDDFFFPAVEKLINKPGAMEENTKGHESFTDGLALFEKYVFVTKPSEFNGRTFRHIIESFAPDLIQHLHDEIPTLMKLHIADSVELRKIWDQAGKIAHKDTDLYTDAPFVIACQDKDFEIDGRKCTFPDLPWIAEALVRNWHAKKFAGRWQFCPSDLYGKRRQMPTV